MKTKRERVLRQEAAAHEAEVAGREEDAEGLEIVVGQPPRDPVQDQGWRPRAEPVEAPEDPLQQAAARVRSSTEEDVDAQGRTADEEEERDWQGQPQAEAERRTRGG